MAMANFLRGMSAQQIYYFQGKVASEAESESDFFFQVSHFNLKINIVSNCKQNQNI